MKALICDCCGKQVDAYIFTIGGVPQDPVGNSILLKNKNHSEGLRNITLNDVCDECYDKVLNFVKTLVKK